MTYLFLSVVLFVVAGLNMWLVRLLGVRERGAYLLAAVAAGAVLGGWLGVAASAPSTAVQPAAAMARGAASGAAGGLIAGSVILAIGWMFRRSGGAREGGEAEEPGVGEE